VGAFTGYFNAVRSFIPSNRKEGDRGSFSTYGEKRGVYGILVGKREGKRPFGIPRLRWEDNIKCIFRKWDVRTWNGLSWLRIGIDGGRL
jgi:hypothetical protein